MVIKKIVLKVTGEALIKEKKNCNGFFLFIGQFYFAIFGAARFNNAISEVISSGPTKSLRCTKDINYALHKT